MPLPATGTGVTLAPTDRYRSFLSPRARLTLLNTTELNNSNNISSSLKAEDRAQIEAVIESMKNADYFDPNYANTTYETMLKSKNERSIKVCRSMQIRRITYTGTKHACA